MNLPIEFFKVEKNELNGQYMVHSECEQLLEAFPCKGKAKANKVKDALNKRANADYQKLKDSNIAPVLTWKKQ